MKITRLKKKSKLPKLVARLKALHEKKAEIGYFSDSGIHPTAKMSYSSLAHLHAFPKDGYHHERNWLEHAKPMKGDRDSHNILKNILKSYIKLDSRIEIEDVLDHIGSVWTQKGKDVLGNNMLLIVTNNPTPLVDTGKLKGALGYKTTLNYTLRYI